MSGKWKRILVAMDFSTPARRALDSAKALIGARGTLVLAHVVPPPFVVEPEVMPDFGRFLESEVRRARSALLPLAATARRHGYRVRCEVRVGPAWLRLLEIAEERGADAIALGASGRSKLDRLLLGSTAERVVRRSPVPVLVVHDRPLKRIRRVLVPVDLGAGSAWALDLVRSLGPRAKVQEALLVVPPERAEASAVVPFYPEAPPPMSREDSEAALARFLAHRRADHVRPIVRVAENAAAGILAYERALPPDLIVIATHGRRGLERMLIGSVAEKVVRHARAPVLIVPEREIPAAVGSLSAGEARRGPRDVAAKTAERPRPRGRRARGPWTGHAHTGRGGPAGRRGGGGPRPGSRSA